MADGAILDAVYRPRVPNGRNRHIRYRPVDDKQLPTCHRALLIERADTVKSSRQWVNEPWFLENFEPVEAGPQGEEGR